MAARLAGLYVVETETDAFLGTLEFDGDTVVVHNGYVGRPTVVAIACVEALVPAELHPDVTS